MCVVVCCDIFGSRRVCVVVYIRCDVVAFNYVVVNVYAAHIVDIDCVGIVCVYTTIRCCVSVVGVGGVVLSCCYCC